MTKTIFITGSTDGIGKLAAIKLAKDGHQIILHGRKSEKLATVIEAIKEASNNKNITGYVADFSDLNAVREMAEQIKKEVPKIDILINNAGVFKAPRTFTPAGLEIRYTVNFFAPILLTEIIMPLLEKGKETRIINLSSAAQATVSFEALRGNLQLPDQDAYAQSKLALTMWSFDLAKSIQNISVIALNPGSLLNTNMVKEAFGKFWSSADKGANIIYDLAVSEEYKGITGKYFDNDKGSFGMAHEDAYDQSKIEKLIEQTREVLNNQNL